MINRKEDLIKYTQELKASIEGQGFQCHPETYKAAIEALEHVTPEKVVFDNEAQKYMCPDCFTHLKGKPLFCEYCGKPLEWGTDDDCV